MTVSVKNLVIALGAAVCAGGIDFASKEYVLKTLRMVPGDAIEMIPGILTFVMSWNYGVNFGLMASDSPYVRYGLIGFSVLVSVALLIWALRRGPDWVFSLGVGLVIGGALGNAYDRFAYGAVADFLNVTCCGIRNPWAFNIADIAIFVGAALLILSTSADEKQAS